LLFADGSFPAYELGYDKLLLSPGAYPLRPPIPGITGLSNVFVLRTMQDMDKIKHKVDSLVSAAGSKDKGKAVVLGAGFIGLEVVENLHRRGLSVTLVEARDHVLPQVDNEMVTSMTNDMRSEGVQVLTDSRATEIRETSPGSPSLVVQLSSGLQLTDVDLVIVSTGVKPESGLAAAAGLAIDPVSKAVAVDTHMRTSDPEIYCVGDACAAPSLLDPAQRMWLPMGGPANRQARLAAEHMVLGEKADKYRGGLGTAIVRCFNSSVGTTGYTEQTLKRMGKIYDYVLVHGQNHASYYPGSEPLAVKVLFDPATRKILGGQVSGGSDGVDKRLDVLATSIAAGSTVDDLAHLELSYAPPFGSARDVLNTAGFAAQNIKAGLVKTTHLGVLTDGTLDPEAIILDVRDSTSSSVRPISKLLSESGNGGRNQVVNVPSPELRNPAVLAKLDPTKHYVTVCNLGKMSYFSARILEQAGFANVESLPGGMTTASPPLTNVAPELASPRPSATGAGAVPTPSTATSDTGSHKAAKVMDVDACGLSCPGPIMQLRKALATMEGGTLLIAKASDPGLEVVSVARDKGVITAQLYKPEEKGAASAAAGISNATTGSPAQAEPASKDVTIVLFSGDLDKVLAALVIANGAVAMGGKATIFATFWGLSALKNDGSLPPITAAGAGAASSEGATVGAAPSLLQKMMGLMLPKGASSLPLSQMNFGGLGPVMMQKVMADRHLPSVQSLFRDAVESKKIRFVACTMSMDALGVPADSLIPGVELGGVAEMLEASSNSKSTLFI
jgi:NADPH-dependent 2,4-dienoyl-CoA reductase/sulfur reductase-like enzyme/peroxiredoxin family protein/rhodanese-related sulfurtransferase/TusA-related sulfurtransferase